MHDLIHIELELRNLYFHSQPCVTRLVSACIFSTVWSFDSSWNVRFSVNVISKYCVTTLISICHTNYWMGCMFQPIMHLTSVNCLVIGFAFVDVFGLVVVFIDNVMQIIITYLHIVRHLYVGYFTSLGQQFVGFILKPLLLKSLVQMLNKNYIGVCSYFLSLYSFNNPNVIFTDYSSIASWCVISETHCSSKR